MNDNQVNIDCLSACITNRWSCLISDLANAPATVAPQTPTPGKKVGMLMFKLNM